MPQAGRTIGIAVGKESGPARRAGPTAVKAAGPALGRLRGIGTPDELLQEAARGRSLPSPPVANTHIHLPPNFSAFESAQEAADQAQEQSVNLLGASNYYDYSVYSRFTELALDRGIYPLFGMEAICLFDDLQRAGILINDPANPGRMYVCGRGITRFASMSPAAAGLLEKMRRNDSLRMAEMIRLLAAIFLRQGITIRLDEAKVTGAVARRHGVSPDTVVLQERHVAQAFQEELFRIVPENDRAAVLQSVLGAAPRAGPADSAGVQNDIRTYLMKAGRPAFVVESFLGFPEAYSLILELGGIPCYPVLADGASPVCPYEDPPEKLIAALKSLGIHCAEFIPLRNEPEVLYRYVTAMRRAGFVVTAGTEHNTHERLPLVPACLGGRSIPETAWNAFVEGSYVIAAHQYLCLHGRSGYVDARGCLNPEFSDPEERIRWFSRLGAAVVARQLSGH